MFRSRKRLREKDRDCGLMFHWRHPVSEVSPLAAAAVLAGLLAVGVAATVRVRVGEGVVRSRPVGKLLLVEDGAAASYLEREARERGPFPFRWQREEDATYRKQLEIAMRRVGRGGVDYRPSLVPVEVAAGGASADPVPAGGLPPLPRRGEAPAVAAGNPAHLGLFVVRSGSLLALEVPDLADSVKLDPEIVGRRFLLEHDRAGRIRRVIPWEPREVSPAVMKWLGSCTVTLDADDGGVGVGDEGWLMVETRMER